MLRSLVPAATLAALASLLLARPAPAAVPTALGPNVVVLDPSMSQASIQSTLDAISTQQVPNQFGSQRFAVLFEPGT